MTTANANVLPAVALERLQEGNRRFSQNVRSIDSLISASRRGGPLADQQPFAIVLGCSDARVPAEMVFDQGLGDLFVIRVAGNIVAPSQVGSVEFAAERFGSRLVVVLGHTHCGAIEATVEILRQPAQPRSRNLSSIVDRVKPAIEDIVRLHGPGEPAELLRRAERANVRSVANHLRHGSALLENLIDNEGLRVVGAEYDLESGVVDFFDGVPLT